LRVVLSPSADADLTSIWRRIAERNPDAADRTIERIANAFHRLLQFPRSGRLREELGPGLRSYVIRPRYVAVYRLEAECLEVVHVLHHARDVGPLFSRD
jgi:toxin ParE1/3/4